MLIPKFVMARATGTTRLAAPSQRALPLAFTALTLLLLCLASPPGADAEGYQEGPAPPGVPAGAFPAPSRPVAGIVTDTWRDEQSRDRAGEAERVMNLLGVRRGLDIADIGAGSGYYTVRLARRIGPKGHVYAEDVVPVYL